MRWKSFLRFFKQAWRQTKTPFRKRPDARFRQLHFEQLEVRELLSGGPTVITAGVLPVSGSTTSPLPVIEVEFSDSMTSAALNPSNYVLLGSSGGLVPINSVNFVAGTTPTDSEVTLTYNSNSPLVVDTYTLYVRGNNLVSATTGEPMSQPGQLFAANSGPSPTNNLAVVNVAGTGTLSTVGNYGIPATSPSVASPTAVAFGDLNDDGIPDLVVVNQGTDEAQIFAGQAVGVGAGFSSTATAANTVYSSTPTLTLTLPTATPTTSKAESIVLADLNGDGKLDLAIASGDSDTVSVFLNTSSSPGIMSFTTAASYTVDADPVGIVAADFDGDGNVDLAVAANTLSGTNYVVDVLAGVGAGVFNTTVQQVVVGSSTPTGVTTPTSIATGVFATVAKPTLVVGGANGLEVLNNTSVAGTISFTLPAASLSTSSITSIAVGTLEAGALPSIADATAANKVEVFQDTGAGAFSTVTQTAVTAGGKIAIGDVNGDGVGDIVVANGSATGGVSILQNTFVGGTILNATDPASPSPIVIDSPNNNLTTGEQVTISGITGPGNNTAANGTWTITDVTISGTLAGGGTITGNGSGPITVNAASATNLLTGDVVTISGSTFLDANGTFTVTVTGPDSFTLNGTSAAGSDSTGGASWVSHDEFSLNGSTGNGAYTGGGKWALTGSITAASETGGAKPIVITSTNNQLDTGDWVKLSGFAGSYAGLLNNNSYQITVLNSAITSAAVTAVSPGVSATVKFTVASTYGLANLDTVTITGNSLGLADGTYQIPTGGLAGSTFTITIPDTSAVSDTITSATITSVVAGTSVTITVNAAAATGLVNGNSYTIAGNSLGLANGTYAIAGLSGNTFTITVPDSAATASLVGTAGTGGTVGTLGSTGTGGSWSSPNKFTLNGTTTAGTDTTGTWTSVTGFLTGVTSAATTNGSTTVTMNSTAGLSVGMAVTGASAGIPTGTTIASIVNSTQVTLSQAATTTNAANTLTFFYSTDNDPVAVALGDTNQDGSLDIVTANLSANDFTVLLGNGTGTFQVPDTIPLTGISTPVQSIAVADLNNDGIDDIIVANDTGSTGNTKITIYPGLGGGQYGAPVSISPGNVKNIVGIAVGRFSATGLVSSVTGAPLYPDIAYIDSADDTVGFLQNKLTTSGQTITAAGFAASGTTTLSVSGTNVPPIAIAVGAVNAKTDVINDFTGDGLSDLVISYGGVSGGFHHGANVNPGVDFLFNTSTSGTNFTFNQSQYDNSGTTNISSLAVGDFNRDGNLDFVAAVNGNPGQVIVNYGDGKGNFPTNSTYNTSVTDPDSVAVADFNNDGYPDIVVTSSSTTTSGQGIAVLLNQLGTGFGTAIQTNVDPGYGLQDVVVSDINGDGIPDVIVSTNLPGSNAVYTGNVTGTSNSGQSPITIDTNTITGLSNGMTVTISGVLGDTAANGTYTIESVTGAGFHNSASFQLVGTTANANWTSGGTWTADATQDNVFVLMGKGNGTFANPVPYLAGPNGLIDAPTALAITPSALLPVTTFTSTGDLINDNLVNNGNFSSRDLTGESGNLLGWQTYDEFTSNGGWGVQTGATSPLSGTSVPPPSGDFQAMLDENNLQPYQAGNPTVNPNSPTSYEGSHALYQDVTIPADATAANFSMSLYINSTGLNTQATTTIAAPSAYTDPTSNPSLDFTAGGLADQQVRVDIMEVNGITGVATVPTVTVGGVTYTNDIQITTADPITGYLVTGDQVTISGVEGDTAANGLWLITVTGANTFLLAYQSGAINETSASNGAYVAGTGSYTQNFLSVNSSGTGIDQVLDNLFQTTTSTSTTYSGNVTGNLLDLDPTTITAVAWNSATDIATVTAGYNFVAGQTVVISGTGGYDGTFTVLTAPTSGTFTFKLTTNPGTVTAPFGTAALSLAGQTVEIRVASASNQGPLLVGVNNVQLNVQFADTVQPTLNAHISNPAFIGAGSFEAISVTNGGSGYTSAPTVVFSGGSGTGAAAVATIVNGAVSNVTITSYGVGYTTAPTVSFSGGGGSGATATAGIPYTSDPTITGQILAPFGLNSIAYIAFDPTGTGNFTGASVVKTTQWDAQGNFSVTLPSVTPGVNTVSIEVVDRAGNAYEIPSFQFYNQSNSVTQWQSVGPQGIDVQGQTDASGNTAAYSAVSGRITATIADSLDPTGNTYLVGTANGGIWRTTDGGKNWIAVASNLTNGTGTPIAIGVGAMAQAAADPNVIYAGTGVGDDQLDSLAGVGILKSTDDGVTWTLLTSPQALADFTGARITSVLCDPNSTSGSIVFVAVAAGGAGPGVYQSLDGGVTWTNILNPVNMFTTTGTLPGDGPAEGAGVALGSVTSMVMDPYNAFGELIIGIGDIQGTNINVPNSVTGGVWYTTDAYSALVDWSQVVGGNNPAIPNGTIPANGALPGTAGNIGRVTVAIGTGAVANTATTYFMFATAPGNNTAPSVNWGSFYGLYKSSDNMLEFTQVMLEQDYNPGMGLHNFQAINLLGDDGANAGALLVDPTDPNVVYVGGSGYWNQSNSLDHSLIYVDTGDMLDADATDANGVIDNNGDDIAKYNQGAIKNAGYYDPMTMLDAYTGEGVYWYDINEQASGTTPNHTTDQLPPEIETLTFDALGRLLVGTVGGIWRGVNNGFGYDFTSGGTGILAQHGHGGGSNFSTAGMSLTSLNGNLSISDLTSVAVDPNNAGTYFTTQVDTGAAKLTPSTGWVSTGLVLNDGVANANLIPTAANILSAQPLTSGTNIVLYRIWQYADSGALIPQISTDDGTTWTSIPGIPAGLSAGEIPAFAINPTALLSAGQFFNQLLFGAAPIFVTVDSSNTWNSANQPTTTGLPSAAAIAPTAPLDFYIGDNLGQIWSTTSGGNPWTIYGGAANGLPNANAGAEVNGIAVMPTTALGGATTLFALYGGATTGAASIAGQHVFESTNGGAMFTPVTGPWGTAQAYAMVIDSTAGLGAPYGKMYLATQVGVFVTTLNANGTFNTWSALGLGLPNVPVVGLAYSSTLQTLAAATLGRGVYTINTSAISVISNQTLTENTTSAAIPFSINDPSGAAYTITASSNDTNLIPNGASLALTYSGTSGTIQLSPALNAYSNIVNNEGGPGVGNYIANTTGTPTPATITLKLTSGSFTATQTFTVGVNFVDYAPTINPAAITNQTVLGYTAPATATSLTVPFTVSDLQFAASALTVTATSSNPALVTTSLAHGVVGANNIEPYTVTLNPQSGQFGVATITLKATDTYGVVATETFQVLVNATEALPFADAFNRANSTYPSPILGTGWAAILGNLGVNFSAASGTNAVNIATLNQVSVLNLALQGDVALAAAPTTTATTPATLPTTTSAAFSIPAVGSTNTVTVLTTGLSVGETLYITDGTYILVATVSAIPVGGTSMTIKTVKVLAGSAGSTMASGAVVGTLVAPTAGSHNGSTAGLIARYGNSGDQNYYEADLYYAGSGNFVAEINKNVNGTITTLASVPVTSDAGTLLLEIDGPSLVLFYGKTAATLAPVAYVDDQTLTTAGGVGIRATAGASVDNFYASAIIPTATQTLPFSDPFTAGNLNQLSNIVTGGSVSSISSSTGSPGGLIQVTTTANPDHLVTGNTVSIVGSSITGTGHAAVNGTFTITVTGPNTFTLNGTASDGSIDSSGAATWVSNNANVNWLMRSGNFNVATGQAIGQAASPAVNLATLNGTLTYQGNPTQDVVVQATAAFSAVGQSAGLVARYSGPTTAAMSQESNLYLAQVVAAAGNTLTVYIEKNVGGTYTILSAKTVAAPAGFLLNGAGGQITFTVAGPSLTLALAGTTVLSVTDATYLKGGTAGIRTVGAAALTNFSVTPIATTATTTTITNVSNSSPTFGQPITITATVTATSGTPNTSAPNTVTFVNGTTVLGTGTLTLVAGVATATYTTTATQLPVGSDTITAVFGPAYGAGGNFGQSTSAASTVTVNPIASTITSFTSSLPTFSTTAQAVTLTAKAASSPSGNAVSLVPGTITFKDITTNTVLGTVPVNSSGVATLTTSTVPAALTYLAAGSHNITAEYNASGAYADYAPSSAVQLTQTVYTADTLTASASATTINYLSPMTFSASVAGVGTPTGTISLYDNTLAAAIGTPQTYSGGTLTISVPSLTAGVHSITLSYVDPNGVYAPASKTFTITVNGAATTTVLSPLSSAVYGQPVTLTATVSDTPAVASVLGAPSSGTVNFMAGSTVLVSGVTYSSATSTSATYTYTTTATQLPVGTSSITAVFVAGGNFAGSTSPALNQTVTAAGTQTVLQSVSSPAFYGNAETFTATVTNTASAAVPVGTVQFKDNGVVIGSFLLTATQAVPGQAVFTTTPTQLVVSANHNISAAFVANTNFGGSTSGAAQALTVAGATTSTTVSATVAGTPGAASSAYSQAVTFTATVAVTSPGTPGTPTGTVTFYNNGTPLNGTLANSTYTVGASGVVSFTTSTLAANTYNVSATYNGNTNLQSSGPGTSLPFIVNPENVNLALTSSNAPAFWAVGQSTTFRATVTPQSPSTATPTGTVQFYDNGIAIGPALTLAGGAAAYAYNFPGSAGLSHAISAVYTPATSNFATTNAALPTATVLAGSTIALKGSVTGTLSQTATLSVTVSSPSGTPSGTVYFYEDGSTTPFASATLSAAGTASVTITITGTHTFTALYGGDGVNFAEEMSGLVTLGSNPVR